MVRNYALAFVAVTLRIQLGVAEGAGIPFAVFYPVVAWSCWVPNLVFVDWFVLGRRQASE
jgi:hypothetical protein